jgi:hypothetical protein
MEVEKAEENHGPKEKVEEEKKAVQDSQDIKYCPDLNTPLTAFQMTQILVVAEKLISSCHNMTVTRTHALQVASGLSVIATMDAME